MGGSFLAFVGMLVIPSVIIRDLDIVGIALAPTETDSKLIVDSDAILPGIPVNPSSRVGAHRKHQHGHSLEFSVPAIYAVTRQSRSPSSDALR